MIFKESKRIISLDTIVKVAHGSAKGLEQALLAGDGQPGLTVLAVGHTTTGKVQGTSLGDGNVIEVFATGDDFSNGIVLYREFMSLGEPIVFTGLTNGAIIVSSEGFYGFSDNVNGNNESPMPLLSLGLSFKSTFVYCFRNSTVFADNSVTNRMISNAGTICVVNGPIESTIALKTGDGVVVEGQENIVLKPWQFYMLGTNANAEYIIQSNNNIMACVFAHNGFYDCRLIMPLTNDGITWPRSGFVSAPYSNTLVKWNVQDGARSNDTSTIIVSPGSPIDLDAAIKTDSSGTGGTGASDSDYEIAGATRLRATGLISAFSGADSAGLEASPLMPTSAMSQVVAQPFPIARNGDGGNSCVSISSPYKGTAKVYSWNDTTKSLDLKYTVPLVRTTNVTTRSHQYDPCAGQIAVEGTASNQLVGTLNPGIIIADVPITVILQSGSTSSLVLRSQNGSTASVIMMDDDESLSLGHTPENIRCEIREDSNGLLRKRTIDNGGNESWPLA